MGSARMGPSIIARPAILHVASSNASLVLCISRLLLLLLLVAACVHASDLSAVALEESVIRAADTLGRIVYASDLSIASEEPVIRAADTLGRIVYLPKVTLMNDHNSDPSIFRAEDINELVKTSTESYTSVDTIWYSSSDKFKKAIAANMGLSGSAKGVTLSVSGEFGRVTGHEEKVKVAEVHAMRFRKKSYISRGDITKLALNEDFQNSFSNLPVLVKDAHDDQSWAPFQRFMSKWGSHIVTSAYTGAVYQSWSSARSEYNYEQWQMTARACVKAEGIKGQGAIEACAGYSQEERQESLKLTTTDTKRVKGGTAETRSKLASRPADSDLLQTFLSEDSADEQPVRYEYLPVWEFLLSRFKDGSDDFRRALALQAYFEGWRAARCPLVITEGQSNNRAQMMVPEYNSDKKHTGYYLCIRRCNGCHNYEKDCWYDAGPACCRSYGPSVLKIDGDDRASRATDYNAGWCDWDNGCKYVVFQGCLCSKSNEENGCNYDFPLNPSDAYWLKYKIIWNQRDEAVNTKEPAIASVVEKLA